MDCLDTALGFCPVCGGNHSKNTEPKTEAKVTSIAEVNGKVIITLDNGTYLSAEMSVVDKNLNGDIQSREEINSLKDKVDKLYDSLITIQSLQGDAFKAFKLDVAN